MKVDRCESKKLYTLEIDHLMFVWRIYYHDYHANM